MAYEEVTLQSFNCDPNWPVCLFDFTFKNKMPEFFCFKIGNKTLDNYITDWNHFGPI